MKYGNHIEHLARDAVEKGRAETPWIGLRNTYFRDGTITDGFTVMVQSFAEMGVRATSEWRNVNGKDLEFIVLTPIQRA